MNERLRNLMERRAKQIADMRAILDKADAEKRDLTAEERQNYDAAENDLSNLEKDIQREERQAQREASMAASANGAGRNPNPGAQLENRTGTAAPEYRSAFLGYMRGSHDFERRALQIGTDSEGGYLCPDEFEKRLIDTLNEENIMRGLCTIVRSDSGDKVIPVVASHGAASWIAEEGAFAESDDAFGTQTLGAHKVGTLIKISEELLNDSAFDMESYIAKEFARRIGAAEEAAFIAGNGTGKPTGLLATAETGVTTAAAAAITSDEIIDLVYSLKPQYRKKASFIMQDATVKAIRKLKDGNQQYIWQPGMQAGQPDRLLGYAIHNSGNMEAVAAGKKAIAFGDYKYYWISDRQGRHFQRLNELYAANGQIGFRAWQRVDGKLLVPEAVKLLVMKTA